MYIYIHIYMYIYILSFISFHIVVLSDSHIIYIYIRISRLDFTA